MIEVKRYRKSDGFATRYWAIYVDGELLAVILYRKGAQAIVGMFLGRRTTKGLGTQCGNSDRSGLAIENPIDSKLPAYASSSSSRLIHEFQS